MTKSLETQTSTDPSTPHGPQQAFFSSSFFYIHRTHDYMQKKTHVVYTYIYLNSNEKVVRATASSSPSSVVSFPLRLLPGPWPWLWLPLLRDAAAPQEGDELSAHETSSGQKPQFPLLRVLHALLVLLAVVGVLVLDAGAGAWH